MPEHLDLFKTNILKAGTDEALIKKACVAQLAFYRENYTLATMKGYTTDCRNILRDLDSEHVGLKYMKLKKAEYNQDRFIQNARISKEHLNARTFDHNLFRRVSEGLIEDYLSGIHSSYQKLALGITGLTGRRFFSEVLLFGRFEISYKGKRFDIESLIFSGQAKTKDYDRPPYKIPVLSDSRLIYEAWRRLRKDKSFIKSPAQAFLYKVTSESFLLSAQEHHDLYKKHKQEIKKINKRVKASVSPDASRLVKRMYRGVADDNVVATMGTHDLRGMYAETCYYQFGIKEKKKRKRDSYFAEILGHRDDDITTAQSYDKFIINE